jgi:hypothetical protein
LAALRGKQNAFYRGSESSLDVQRTAAVDRIGTSLEIVGRRGKATGRKPETIKKMAMRLGISFRPNAKKK